MKECVVILGMHRSGTSVLSGLVSLQGFHIGVSEMPVRDDNPKGFFENYTIYRFNQRILEDQDSSWDSYSFNYNQISSIDLKKYQQEAKIIIKKEFGLAKKIFIKDPRMCLLFPLWQKVLEELGFKLKVIYVFRSPMEVALSLKTRNAFAFEKSILLWSHYCFQAEVNSRSYKRFMVHYVNDFNDLDTFVENLSVFLGGELTADIIQDAHKLFTPELKHHQLGFNNLSDDMPAYLKEFIELLKNGKVEQVKKLDKIIDDFYFSQELYLYDDASLRKEIISLKNERSKLQKDQSAIEEEYRQYKEYSAKKYDQFRLDSSIDIDVIIKKYNGRIIQQKKDAGQEVKRLKERFKVVEREAKLKVVEREAKLLKNKDEKIESLCNSLNVGSELFFALQTDRKLRNKFSRVLIDSKYFKKKRILSPFSSIKNKNFLDEKIEIIESGLFSSFYYLSRHPKAWHAQVDPLNFFNKHGWKAGHDPGPEFNTRYYLKENPDVARTGENPLLHYIRTGKNEGRLPRPKNYDAFDSQSLIPVANSHGVRHKRRSSSNLFLLNYRGETKGCITSLNDGYITGWLASRLKYSIPIIKISGIPAVDIQFNLPCDSTPEDVKQDVGFSAKVLNSVKDSADIELLLLSEAGVIPVAKETISTHYLVSNKYSDLERALEISTDNNSVAITVWEGSHNPLGRAKVLYDIVAQERPVVIFAYTFGSFGDVVWKPLQQTGMNIVLIPYSERYRYQAYIQKQNISFNTVWVCKHRLHSMELAAILSKPNTACILDIDDNEDVFVSSKASEFKPYGIFSKNKANYYLDRMQTRSVASISIQKTYGGCLVRHARRTYKSENSLLNQGAKTAVFIGTIRPHKNVAELLNAIVTFNKSSSEKITLAIGGDFNPPALKRVLDTSDTIILDTVANDDLFDTLINYDIVITGFPDKESENSDINKLQITSKIGDGLAVGLPVLTPSSPSVEDLHNIPGLFVFTASNFGEKLKAAMAYTSPVVLPEEFTLEYSYKVFNSLEKQARRESKAHNIFELEPLYYYGSRQSDTNKNIVLIWKQHDAGVYGRRIDHIARYYKQKHPDSNVTIIEAVHEDKLQDFENSNTLFDNSTVIFNDVLSQKIYRYTLDGVEYRLITYRDQKGWNSFSQKFDYFLSSEGIYPYNAVMILFPILDIYKELLSIIKEYKIIVDLVDNQVKWMKRPEVRLDGLKQYYDLLAIADEVVANSPTNIEYFKKLNFFESNSEPKLIPNWYTLPKSISFERDINKNEINLIYSGNMNDRIDWDLFKNICNILKKHNGYLHIVGTTVRSSTEMQRLLKQPNCIYHGVINEIQLLRLLQHINFAVIPHIEDDISKFMDPIKLKMYKKLGITSLCSQLPGLPAGDPMLLISDSRKDFLCKLEKFISERGWISDEPDESSAVDLIAEQYVSLIDALLE